MSSLGIGTITEKLSYLFLVLVVLLTPIFFIPSVSFPFEGTKIAIIAFGVLLSVCFYAVSCIERQELSYPKRLAIYAVWLVPLAYAVSALWNNSLTAPLAGGGLEVDSLYFIGLGALALTLTASVSTGERRLKMFCWAGMVTFVVITIFQTLRLMGGADFMSFNGLFSGSAANLLGKWNEIGVFYGLAACLSLVGLSLRAVPLQKIGYIVALVISLFFIVLVNVNVVWWLVALVALGVAVSGFLAKRNASSSKSAAFVAMLVLLVSVFFLLPASWLYSGEALAKNPEPRNFLANKFGVVYLEARPSWEGTVTILKHTYADRMLLGSGPGTFVAEWLKAKPVDINKTIFWNVDFTSGIGFVPTSFVTTGLIGLLAWAVFLGALLYMGLRAFLFKNSESQASDDSLLSFISAAYLFIAAIFYSPGPVLLILAFVCAGLFFASLRTDGFISKKLVRFEENPRFGFVATLVAIVLFLGAAASMFLFGTRYVSAVQFQKASIAFNRDGNLEKSLENAALAATFGQSDKSSRLSAAIELALVQKTLNDTTLTAEEARANFEKHFNAALAHATRATELNPNDYENWTALGKVSEVIVPLGNEAANEKAAKAYDRAIALNPNNPILHLLRGNLEVMKGSQKTAKPFIQKAIDLKPDYTEAIFAMAQIQVSENNVPEAIKSVEQTVTLAPNNAVLFFQLGLLYYSQNRFQDAGAAFMRATQLNKDYANAHYFLGLTFEQLRSRPDALREFQEVLRTNPDNADVQKMVENLKANKSPFVGFEPPKTGDIRKLDGLPVNESGPNPAPEQ